MSTRHTPGPWEAFDGYDESNPRWTIETTHTTIAYVRESTFNPNPKATAHLIAAAPDLLEACKAALSDDQPYIEKCRAAIAKATGEQP
jgi:hypothetical protein